MSNIPFGAFVAMLCVTVVCLLWPWWRRQSITRRDARLRQATNVRLYQEHMAELQTSFDNQLVTDEEYQTLRSELSRSFLEEEGGTGGDEMGSQISWYWSLPVLVFVVSASWLLYDRWGAGDDLEIRSLLKEQAMAQVQAMQGGAGVPEKLRQELIDKLSERLEEKPENIMHHYYLAQAFVENQDFAAAAQAYRNVLDIDPAAAQVWGEYAQALFFANGNQSTPVVMDAVRSTLELDPHNAMALGVGGISAFQEGRFQDAIDFWQRAMVGTVPGSPGAMSLQAGIDRARKELAAQGIEPQVAQHSSGPAITVDVSLSAEAQVDPSWTVFVFARAVNGPRLPLAVQRLKVADLPVSVVLDDSKAMNPAFKLSTAEQVMLVARVSQSGTVESLPGDWQGQSGPVAVAGASTSVKLKIDAPIH